MKKFIFSLLLMMAAVMSVNAQVAYQKSNFFDNTYVGLGGMASTPLTFDNVFPLNSAVQVKVGKQFTPIFGIETEGSFFFGSQNYPGNTVFRASDVTIASTVNLSNLFCGYKGEPRFFEVTTNVGLGWTHFFSGDHVHKNDLTAKTGVDCNFNLGKEKAWTIYVEPAVLWNLTGKGNDAIQFNRNYGQLALSVGVVYHFKNSANKHYIKQWNVGEMNDEINALRAENTALKNQKPQIVERVIEKSVPVTNAQNIASTYSVSFAQGSAVLSDAAKAILDKVPENSIVDVAGSTSPEGGTKINTKLAQDRADAVKDYLASRGVKVNSALGGASGRVAVVTVK